MTKNKVVPCEFEGCDRSYSTEHSRRQHYRRFHKGEWISSAIRRRAPSTRQLEDVGHYDLESEELYALPPRRSSEPVHNKVGKTRSLSESESHRSACTHSGKITGPMRSQALLPPKKASTRPRKSAPGALAHRKFSLDRGYIAPRFRKQNSAGDIPGNIQGPTSPFSASPFDSALTASKSTSFSELLSALRQESPDQPAPQQPKLVTALPPSCGVNHILPPPQALIHTRNDASPVFNHQQHSPYLADRNHKGSLLHPRLLPYDAQSSAHAAFISQLSGAGQVYSPLSKSAPLVSTAVSPMLVDSGMSDMKTEPRELYSACTLNEKMIEDLINTLSTSELQSIGSLTGVPSIGSPHDSAPVGNILLGRSSGLSSSLSQPMGTLGLGAVRAQPSTQESAFTFSGTLSNPSPTCSSHHGSIRQASPVASLTNQSLDVYLKAALADGEDTNHLLTGMQGPGSPCTDGASTSSSMDAGRVQSAIAPSAQQDAISDRKSSSAMTPSADLLGTAFSQPRPEVSPNANMFPHANVRTSASASQYSVPFGGNGRINVTNTTCEPIISPEFAPKDNSGLFLPFSHISPSATQNIGPGCQPRLQPLIARRATFPYFTQMSLPGAFAIPNARSSISATPDLQVYGGPTSSVAPQQTTAQLLPMAFMGTSGTPGVPIHPGMVMHTTVPAVLPQSNLSASTN